MSVPTINETSEEEVISKSEASPSKINWGNCKAFCVRRKHKIESKTASQLCYQLDFKIFKTKLDLKNMHTAKNYAFNNIIRIFRCKILSNNLDLNYYCSSFKKLHHLYVIFVNKTKKQLSTFWWMHRNCGNCIHFAIVLFLSRLLHESVPSLEIQKARK